MKNLIFFFILVLIPITKINSQDINCKCIPLTLKYKFQDAKNWNRDTLIQINIDSALAIDTCNLNINTKFSDCGEIYQWLLKYGKDIENRIYAKKVG